jgi:tetratricopeptide (TPR) repeat protein
VGRELKVQAVLLGRLVQRGESLSISAELVEARDGRHLWGEQYSRKLADLLAIQEELGREISENLRPRLTGEQKKALAKRHTETPEAYQEYLKGLYFFNKKTGPSIQTAIEHFNRAVALDPSYARAYAGLAECHYLISYFSAVPPRESLPKLQAAANKAIQLDETLAEAHVAQAVYKEGYDWDWAGAEREYRRALELNPAHANAHLRYAANLIVVGRFEEAISQAKRALELEPVSVAISTVLGVAYHYGRRYDQAVEQYGKTLAMDPNFGSARHYLGELYIAKSMYPEALAELKEAVKLTPGAPLAASALGLAYARSGDRAAAQKVLDGMLAERARRGYYPASRIALVYLGLGDQDRAFEHLTKAVEEGDLTVAFLKTTPVFDPLRSDPRFTDLLRRMNLAP